MSKQHYSSVQASVRLAVALLSLFTARLSQAQDYVFHDLYTLGTPTGWLGNGPPTGIGPGGQVVGWGDDSSGNPTAGVWNQTDPAGVSLYPGEYSWGTDGYRQVGVYLTNRFEHAALWSGTADSLIDLDPTPIIDGVPTPWNDSVALSSSGEQQVGFGRSPDGHAVLWSGSSASFVDLHPTGCSSSYTHGVGGGRQVGSGYPTNATGSAHAFLWSGTAASAVDLHPAGYSQSFALATDGTQQVGFGVDTNSSQHGLLWVGAASSYVELGNEEVYAVGGGKQIGFSAGKLTVWSGTAQSAVNLSALLPSNLGVSEPPGFGLGYAQGTVALDAQGTILAIAQEAGGPYHAVEFVPTPLIKAVLRILSIQYLANGHVLLKCAGVASLSYSLQATSSLTADFSSQATAAADSSGAFQFEDTSPGTQRFYRLAYP